MIDIEKRVKIIAVLISAAAITMCLLPIMSINLSGTEKCTLIVHGYNLIGFSALGCVPIIAPLFIPAVMVGGTDKNNYITMLCIFSVHTVCYIHGINASKEWCASVCTGPITYHAGVVNYPGAFILALIAVKIMSSCIKIKDAI